MLSLSEGLRVHTISNDLIYLGEEHKNKRLLNEIINREDQ